MIKSVIILFVMNLNNKNLIKRSHVLKMPHEIRTALKPIFKFGEYKRENKPAEFLSIACSNKLNTILVSIENIIHTNDTFLSVYIYRYLYELYFKIKHITSSELDIDFYKKIDKFFLEKQRSNISEQIKSIDKKDPVFTFLNEKHRDTYLLMNLVVHPNIESLSLHTNSSDDSMFEYLIPNVMLSLLLIKEILSSIVNDDRIQLESNPDMKMLKEIFIDIEKYNNQDSATKK